jgi:hypothetical protein
VLIVPDGSAATMFRELGDPEVLQRWVREGGAVIAIGGAIELLARDELELTTVKPVGADDEEDAEEDEEEEDEPADTAAVSESARPVPPLVSPSAPDADDPEPVPGVVARATLDRSHWLTYGYARDHLPVLVSGGGFLMPSREGDNAVTIVGDDAVISGFVWPGNTTRLLDRTVWAVVENVGNGRVILFAEDPLFRAFWRGPAGLFQNALLMGPRRE